MTRPHLPVSNGPVAPDPRRSAARAGPDHADHLVFRSSLAKIGCFRAEAGHPLFRASGPILDTIFVFPRTSVLLQHTGSRPFPASPNMVTFWNRGQVCRRQPIDPVGYRCEYFAVRPDVLLEAIRTFDRAVEDRPEEPFAFHSGPSDAAAYLLQRALVHHLVSQPGSPDLLRVEEAILALLDRVVRLAYGTPRPEETVTSAHRDLAYRLVAELATSFPSNRSLGDLASSLGCSPYYLARVFRRVDGRSIHQYRLQLRLRRSLEVVAEAKDLGRVGLELGFSSHSHFTAAFRHAFGLAPSRFRERATSNLLHSLLTAM